MSEPPSSIDNDHYERACDQAIAMCDGNLRSTIKALIMANEYLELELFELPRRDCPPAACRNSKRQGAARPERREKAMADITYYVAMPFLQSDNGTPVAGTAEECRSSATALRRAEMLSRARPRRRECLQPHR